MQDTLARKLRVLRAERGLTLREAEQLTGVDKDTLSKIERGLRHPYDVTLSKLAKGYGVPVEELLEEPVLAGKAEAPQETGPLEEEQRLRYLRGWRAFIYGLARRWEENPPQTREEIDPTLGALAPLLDQGVFDLSGHEGPSEVLGLELIRDGLGRLAQIAEKVEGNDAVVRDIRENLSA
jgi:transcriptional regulator with XRE-family HTH domain